MYVLSPGPSVWTDRDTTMLIYELADSPSNQVKKQLRSPIWGHVET